MIDQLPLFEAEKADANVAAFVELLKGAEDWLTAGDVLRRLILPDTDARRRAVRAWAEAAEDVIISGQRGYRHVDRATIEEIDHFANWMESQGTKMIARAIKTRRHAHQLVG